MQPGCVGLRHTQFVDETGVTQWYFTIYCHLKLPFAVTVGASVSRGQQIGQAWSTGTSASTPHIHVALFSATNQSAGNRRAEPMLSLGATVVRDAAGNGPYQKFSWPSDGSANQYFGWLLRRP